MRSHAAGSAPHLKVSSPPYLQALIATFVTIAMLELDLGNAPQHGLNLILAVWFALLIRPMGGSKAEAWTIFGLLAFPASVSLALGFDTLSPTWQVGLELFWVVHPLAIAWVIGRRLLRERDVAAEELWGAITVYVLIGLSFANIYFILWILTPGSLVYANLPVGVDPGFSEFLYFSFVTLGTVGYGDVAPVTSGVRLVAMFEALVGLMYIAVIIGRIVALHTAGGLRRIQTEQDPTVTSGD